MQAGLEVGFEASVCGGIPIILTLRQGLAAEPCAVPRAEVLIMESTFGKPQYLFPSHEKVMGSIADFCERALGDSEIPVLLAYSLGKAQRVIRLLREAGWDRPIFVHGALERINAVYGRFGVALGPLLPATSASKAALAGQIAIAPPSALATPWARRFPDPVDAFASGWMRIRARARQQGVELPLIISDHADWDELTRTLEEIRPAEVWITHGREEALARWCDLAGIPARALALVGYEDEGD